MKTKFSLPYEGSLYIISETPTVKEALFVSRVYLYKNASMLSPDELNNYFNSISILLKNQSTHFNTLLSTKVSSAIDYVDNIKNLLSLAEKTNEEQKRLILLSQVDLILKKIGENKTYFYICFSDQYTNDDEARNFYEQKVSSVLRYVQNMHSHYSLSGAELVQFLSENFSLNTKNKIFITEQNVNKVFKNTGLPDKKD